MSSIRNRRLFVRMHGYIHFKIIVLGDLHILIMYNRSLRPSLCIIVNYMTNALHLVNREVLLLSSGLVVKDISSN